MDWLPWRRRSLSIVSHTRLELILPSTNPYFIKLGFRIGSKGNESELFLIRVFKFYSPKNQKSRVSLVAHRREVSGTSLEKYIPEFEGEFCDVVQNGHPGAGKNYIIRAYVFGKYLDDNVSMERGGFEFGSEGNDIFDIGQRDIEKQAAQIAQSAIGSDIKERREKKKERVHAYVDEKAPWYKSLLNDTSLDELPLNPTSVEIEKHFHIEKFNRDAVSKQQVENLINSVSDDGKDIDAEVALLVQRITDSSRDDLVKYVVMRKSVLGLFKRSLELDENDEYKSEGRVHDIILPRGCDSLTINFEDHNLWILDERLNFTTYVTSDNALGKGNKRRPDVLSFGIRHLFKEGEDESNGIIIFEFKRPMRSEFIRKSSKEDPVDQIVDYVRNIRDGNIQTPQGRPVKTTESTPAFGFVVMDVVGKTEQWLTLQKDFKSYPDGRGWYKYYENLKLYIEVLTWSKVLSDAESRNAIFFKKLGIH